MRLALKGTVLLVVFYLLGLSALVWWARQEVADSADTLMAHTAEALGRELAAALNDELVDELLQGNPADRRSLLELVQSLTRRSEMVRGAQVIDRDGEIFASEEFVDIGRAAPRPEELFGKSRKPRLVTVRGHLGRAIYVLEIPLEERGDLAGYLRLQLRSSSIEALYRKSWERTLLIALLGLLLIGSLGGLLHLELVSRNRALLQALESALEGEPESVVSRDDFGNALAIAHQLSQEVRRHRELSSEAARRLDALTSLLDVGVLLLDASGEVELANQRAATLLELPAQPSDTAWREALEPVEELLERNWSDFSRHQETTLELGSSTRRRRLRVRVLALGEEDGAGYLVQLSDQEMLQLITSDLRLASQLKALMRLYMGVAHDLKAPLNAMVLNLELLRRSVQGSETPTELGEKQKRWIGILEEELQRLRRTLEVLLAQTAPPRMEPGPFDLAEVVSEVEALLAPQARQQGVTLQFEGDRRALGVFGHRDHVKQALLNVTINALEAMADGGELDIASRRDGSFARLRISDTGPGIPECVLASIFDANVTTKEGGTGIGLFVAASILESAGGSIEVAATGVSGTTFDVTLPLNEEAS